MSAEHAAAEVGSWWVKNDVEWTPRPGERYLVRVECITPLGRPVLRRIDCQHEWVCDMNLLLRAYDRTEPFTVVVYDFEEKRAKGLYPWRTKCPDCGWGDTFVSEVVAQEWATRHDAKHAADNDGSDER